jgi:hypothetical protein
MASSIMKIPLRLAALALGISVASFAPADASACGGTFCNSNAPQVLPIDQTGENILFVMDGETVEAHIQIQYQGDAARFAWVIPVQATPTFRVGSQQLFTNMLGATVPTYSLQNTYSCPTANCSSGKGGAAGSSAGFGSAGSSGGANAPPEGPTITFRGAVGAFDIVVLSGGTAAEVTDWLETNQYFPVPGTTDILQKYLEQGYLFVAVKLTNGADIDEIHPLVVSYAGSTPCVPIRLTAVGAVEDMDIRTFFLGDMRAVPSNYRHVYLEPLRIDFSSPTNYKKTVSEAVDSPGANGHAFVTEYAGRSSVVSPVGLWSSSWNAAAFESISAVDVVHWLNNQGLVTCSKAWVPRDQIGSPGATGTGGTGGQGGNSGFAGGGGVSIDPGGETVYVEVCGPSHPLVGPILHQYLPPPEGMDERVFYGDLSSYSSLIDTAAFSSLGFAADLNERVIEPGKHAMDLLAAHTFLTRMYTTLSPAEMTEDPEFTFRDDLPQVDPSSVATRQNQCNACYTWRYPGDIVVYSETQNPIFPAGIPAARRIEELGAVGGSTLLVDNTQLVKDTVQAYNDASSCPRTFEAPKCPSSVGGAGGAAGHGGGSRNAGAGASSDEAGGEPTSPTIVAATDDGEACSMVERKVSPRSAALAVLALAALGWAGRRRRR